MLRETKEEDVEDVSAKAESVTLQQFAVGSCLFFPRLLLVVYPTML